MLPSQSKDLSPVSEDPGFCESRLGEDRRALEPQLTAVAGTH